jgi:hypothetical protein
MKSLYVIGGAVVAAGLYVFAKAFPDIRRYMKLSSL